jgi:MoaA/NifB/PqqE/SkfB family radical SAM enzyme
MDSAAFPGRAFSESISYRNDIFRRSAKMYTSISTNGHFLTQKISSDITEAGLTELSFPSMALTRKHTKLTERTVILVR